MSTQEVQIFPDASRLAWLESEQDASTAAHDRAMAASQEAQNEIDRLQAAWRRINAQLIALNADRVELRASAIDRVLKSFIAGDCQQIVIPDEILAARPTKDTVSDLTEFLKEIVEHRIPAAQEAALRLRVEELQADETRLNALADMEAGKTMATLGPALQREGQLMVDFKLGATGERRRNALAARNLVSEAQDELKAFQSQRKG